MDETSYQTCYQHSSVLSNTGFDMVPGGKNGKVHESFTVIITISKANTMLPAWYISHGITDRSHQQFNIDELNIHDVVVHSKNGWMTEDIIFFSLFHSLNMAHEVIPLKY